MSALASRAKAALLSGGYERVVRPRLFKSFGGDPEAVHEWMIGLLARVGSNPFLRGALRLAVGQPSHPATVAGVRFPNRVGLAAGLDKDGLAAKAWAGLGFGFAELGTVTARAQPGNPKPRVFRLPGDLALVNRMGFNNLGARQLAATLNRAGIYRGNQAAGLPIGISIGKTKATELADAVPDYLASLEALARHADYIAVNVSSPNTPGLRSLQGGAALDELAAALVGRADELAARERVEPVPIFVKIAPDLDWPDIDAILAAGQDARISGVIATNTTLSREGATDAARAQEGGLSGRPLTAKACQIVNYISRHSDLPVIGVGGVMTPVDARAMFDAGASLIQLYTGFIYAGPGLALKIGG
ncbi:MAG: quinone-dependent dihydroorotate dehydrogenase [Propionibacteriaceae bacterium]|jgi:dihydroorotate dehydrogenase|nr:quinone-dependent dihydroorotate dehydrogenase [Propionibacteriaceae bacterium]